MRREPHIFYDYFWRFIIFFVYHRRKPPNILRKIIYENFRQYYTEHFSFFLLHRIFCIFLRRNCCVVYCRKRCDDQRRINTVIKVFFLISGDTSLYHITFFPFVSLLIVIILLVCHTYHILYNSISYYKHLTQINLPHLAGIEPGTSGSQADNAIH